MIFFLVSTNIKNNKAGVRARDLCDHLFIYFALRHHRKRPKPSILVLSFSTNLLRFCDELLGTPCTEVFDNNDANGAFNAVLNQCKSIYNKSFSFKLLKQPKKS